MDERRAQAYRHVLYMALVDIRGGGSAPWWNPLRRHHAGRRARLSRDVADWLHNMAAFSARSFAGFDEERFWAEHESLCRRWPSDGLERYRRGFDLALTGTPGGASYWPGPPEE